MGLCEKLIFIQRGQRTNVLVTVLGQFKVDFSSKVALERLLDRKITH
jgi:hypothetical protein